MKSIIQIIDAYASGKKVLWLFLGTNLVYAMMLIVTIPKTMQYANGMKLLDMMPMGYDYAYINALFEALGEQGRQVYLYYQIPVDMVYPFLFAISYCLTIGYFLKKLNKLNTVFSYLCLLPLIAGIADYFENIGIIALLSEFPDLSTITAILTNISSIIKSMTTSVYFVALIITLLFLGVKTIKERKSSTGMQ